MTGHYVLKSKGLTALKYMSYQIKNKIWSKVYETHKKFHYVRWTPCNAQGFPKSLLPSCFPIRILYAVLILMPQPSHNPCLVITVIFGKRINCKTLHKNLIKQTLQKWSGLDKINLSRTEYQLFGAIVCNAINFKLNAVWFRSFKAMNDTVWGCIHV